MSFPQSPCPWPHRPVLAINSSMKKSKQLSFFPSNTTPLKKFFGGALLNGKRKSMRPLSSKDAIHLVLRSEWATGRDSFLARRNQPRVNQILLRFAKKFGVRIYRTAINGNHIHLLVRITNRKLYRAFIKAAAGKIASQVMGGRSFTEFFQEKNANSIANSKGGYGSLGSAKAASFWQFRPFSRVVNWGNDFKGCVDYLKQNTLEAIGFVKYVTRKNHYGKWLKNISASATIPHNKKE